MVVPNDPGNKSAPHHPCCNVLDEFYQGWLDLPSARYQPRPQAVECMPRERPTIKSTAPVLQSIS